MTNLAETTPQPYEDGFSISVNLSENPSVKGLLDAIVSILADEYIQTAKEHPEIFSE